MAPAASRKPLFAAEAFYRGSKQAREAEGHRSAWLLCALLQYLTEKFVKIFGSVKYFYYLCIVKGNEGSAQPERPTPKLNLPLRIKN